MPLVTCLLPGNCDRRLVAQAIYYFLRQDHPTSELIVLVAPGTADRVEPRGGNVRVVVVDPAELDDAGAVWARGRAEARGELLAWWSPTDWIGPDRISAQVRDLGDAGAVAARSVLTYRLRHGDAVQGEETVPASAMVRRDASLEHRVAVEDPGWYLCVETRRTPDGRSARPLRDAVQRIGDDSPFYAALRAGSGSGTARPHVRRRRAGLTLAVPLMVFDGLGSMGEYLALALTEAGIAVNLAPWRLHREGLRPDLLALLERSRPDPADPVLVLSWIGHALEGWGRAPVTFVNAMWESTVVPAAFVERLNTATAVICPSGWVADTFRDSGVRVPIAVVPQGVDPQRYPFSGPRRGRGLTTLIVAAWAARKNLGESVAAWQLAFDGDPDARLMIKTRFGGGNRAQLPDDERISVVDDNEESPGIAHRYRQADVLLALGGEGFGLPLLEGMACGLPVVALDAQGQADTCALAGDAVLRVPAADWVPYDDGQYRSGLRAVPDVPSVAAALRWVADHRDDADAMGQRASEWVRRERDVWSMGPAMLRVLAEHLGGTDGLSLAEAIVHPESDGRARAYALALRRAVPRAAIRSGLGDASGFRLVDVQYDADGFDDAALDRFVRGARLRGTTVLVTAHRLPPQPTAWECAVDLLVGADDEVVAALRHRWPARRVERLTGEPATAHTELWDSIATA